MKEIVVTAGLLLHKGQLLISQREAPLTGGGFWEFPGGKVEPGETPRQCLTRELEEELGLRVQVGPMMDSMVVEQFEKRITLLFFHCRLSREQQPRPLDGVADFAWRRPGALTPEIFLPADRAMVERIAGREKAFLAHEAAAWQDYLENGSWVEA
ncbi:MAG: (deoxy)nucleoside triphosphate pyrophosphohydrolase [Christensenellales bacterium]|jgi:8-oxo-dGTP diphosphatase